MATRNRQKTKAATVTGVENQKTSSETITTEQKTITTKPALEIVKNDSSSMELSDDEQESDDATTHNSEGEKQESAEEKSEETENLEESVVEMPLTFWDTMPKIEEEDGRVLVPLHYCLIGQYGADALRHRLIVQDTTPYWDGVLMPFETVLHDAIGLSVELSTIRAVFGIDDQSDESKDTA